MAKKRNTGSLKETETGLGILEGLNTLDNPADTENKEEQKNKRVEEEKKKDIKEQKSKRSFMLTASQIEKIYLLKAKNPDKDLSVIVGNAIDLYFDKINENLKTQTEKKESVDSGNSETPKRKLKRYFYEDD